MKRHIVKELPVSQLPSYIFTIIKLPFTALYILSKRYHT